MQCEWEESASSTKGPFQWFDSLKVDLPLERLRLFPQLFAPTHRASYRSFNLSPTSLHFVSVVCFPRWNGQHQM
jgi:hypothetical protein